MKLSEVKSVNLEITNKCMLKCDRCARTNNSYIRKNLTDMSLDFIERVFDEPTLGELPDEFMVNLCGVYGDCIYHSDFLGVIQLLKSKNLKVNIETNGSYKTRQWWEHLCSLLDEQDIVTFSIDGLEDTNHLYRVNSRWQDIMLGMDICVAAACKVYWKFIVFAHNEAQIEEAKSFAKTKGIDRFILRKSGRFHVEDPLRPDEKWVGIETKNRIGVESIEGNTEKIDEEIVILPRCLNTKKNIGITYDGFVFPCCTASSLVDGWFKENKHCLDLSKYGLEEILCSTKLGQFFEALERPSKCPSICRSYCGVPKSHLVGVPIEIQANLVKEYDRIIFEF